MRRAAFTSLGLAVFLMPGMLRAQTKIGFVNLQSVVAAAPGAKEAQAEFQKDLQGYEQQVTNLRNELQQMQSRLQQQQSTLSAEAKKNREQRLEAKQRQYQQRYQDLQKEAAQRRQALMRPILAKVDSVIEQIRKEGSYALILDASAGSILAADSTLDLTQDVVRRMSPPASSASAGGPARSGTGGSR